MFSPFRNRWAILRRRPWLSACVVLAAAAGMFFVAWHGRAWYHYAAARSDLAYRDFPEALRHLDICRAVWSGSASTHLLCARVARRANRFKEAEKYLAASRRLRGSAETEVLEEYLLQAQQGGLEKVESKLRAFLQKEHPDCGLILEVLTNEWMQTYRLDQALSHLEMWLKLQPQEREALIRKGWVLEHMDNPSAAVAAYQEALEIDAALDRHEQDRVRLRLAELLVKQNRPQEAAAHLEILASRQPKNPTAVVALARCRFLQGQAEEAGRLLDILLADSSTPKEVRGQALGERGRIALLAGDAAGAERWLRQAAQFRPGDHAVISAYLDCLRRLGKEEQAKVYARRLQQLQDDEHAMARLMRAVMETPEDPELRCQVGRIFLRNGFVEDGRRWLELALSYDPTYRPAHQVLAEHYESAGDRKQAALHRRALKRP